MALDRVAHLPSWLLSQAQARAQRVIHSAFTEAGVRGYHYRLMAALEQYGPLSQADLGRHTGIDRKDVAIAVAELADRKIIARQADPSDRRRNIVRLTPAGERELLRLDGVLARAQAEIVARLTAAEQRQLTPLLEKLAASDRADTFDHHPQ